MSIASNVIALLLQAASPVTATATVSTTVAPSASVAAPSVFLPMTRFDDFFQVRMIRTEAVAAADASASCFTTLDTPVEAAQMSTYCPRPGLTLPAVVGQSSGVIFGHQGDLRVSWKSDERQTVIPPQSVIHADSFGFGPNVERSLSHVGVEELSEPYALVVLDTFSEADDAVVAAQNEENYLQRADRAARLVRGLQVEGEQWLDVTDIVDWQFWEFRGIGSTTARARGCLREGGLVVWVATGKQQLAMGGRILIKGYFPGAEMRECMGAFNYVEMGRLFASFPELREMSDRHQPANVQAVNVWSWVHNERQVGWTFWDSMSLLGIRVKQGATWATTVYLVVPIGPNTLECSTVAGHTHCIGDAVPQ